MRVTPEVGDQIDGVATKCHSRPATIARAAIEEGLPGVIQRLYDFERVNEAAPTTTEECPRDGASRPEARRGESSHAPDYHAAAD